jgi:predicted signal transduction protein with EAL and GGDEF domain
MSQVIGYPVFCEEDEDDFKCYENRKVEITGDNISEVIRKTLKAYYDTDLITFRVGGECIGYYIPLKNTLNIRVDFTNYIGDGWEYSEVNTLLEPIDC